MQIKTSMRYHYKPIRMTKLQNTDTPNVAENENRNFHSLLTGKQKWYSHLRRQFGSFLLAKYTIAYYPAIVILCWRRLLRVPSTARRSNQSILKEISPGCSLEGLMLKLKLQYFGHLMRRIDSLEKTDAGRDWGQEEKGTTEDEMAGWHHWLDGHELEWTLGVGDGQGDLACCDSWGCKESDTTE